MSDIVTYAISNNPSGKTLDGIERWSRFKNGESREYWIKALGPTAIGSTHQPYFANICADLSILERSTVGEISSLYLACLVHDLGEARYVDSFGGVLEVGDVPSIFKNQTHADGELYIANLIIDQLIFNNNGFSEGSFMGNNLRETLKEVYHSIAYSSETKLGMFFDACEKFEYVLTELTVYWNSSYEARDNFDLDFLQKRLPSFRNILKEGDIYPIKGARKMVKGAKEKDVPIVIEYAKKYKSIDLVLQNLTPTLDSMYAFYSV